MSLRYGSVSSGIECAAIAWAPLGWSPAFLAEIDPFASTVLHHHHSSGRPRHMPDPDAPDLTDKERKARRNAIKAVQDLPERANGVPNHGDMTTYEEWDDADIDVLVGGTPCQAFSVAGLRDGLDDPRGDLTLTYAAIARRYRPRWVVWENVFGVLSHDGGRSFASLLGLLSGRRVEVPSAGWKSAGIVEGYGRAYGLAWRVFDTQYVRVDGFGRAIPQRRRRVFVVGYLGDWRRAAAVLFEREGLSGNPAPRRRSGEEAAATVAGGARGRGGYSADDIPLTEQAFGGGRTSGPVDVAACLTAKGQRIDFEVETFVTARDVAATLTRGADSKGKGGPDGRRQEDDDNLVAHAVAPALTLNPYGDHESRDGLLVAHTLRAEGFDASADATGRGTPLVPICFNSREDPEVTWDRAGSLGSSTPQAQAIAYGIRSDAGRSGEAKTPSVDATGAARLRPAGFNVCEEFSPTLETGTSHTVAHGWAVRRLTPRECCRLQGIPADYFDDVVWRGKSAPDGQIYKTLGNGFSANVVRWIGRRIEMVEAIVRDLRVGRAA